METVNKLENHLVKNGWYKQTHIKTDAVYTKLVLDKKTNSYKDFSVVISYVDS